MICLSGICVDLFIEIRSYIGNFTVANVSIMYFRSCCLFMQEDVIETSLVNASQIHNYSLQLTIT